MTNESHEALINAFWNFSADRNSLQDSERLLQIKERFSAHLFRAVRIIFDLQEHSLERLLNTSISTLRRRGRDQKPLNFVASERLDRIAVICHGCRNLTMLSAKVRRLFFAKPRLGPNRFAVCLELWNGVVRPDSGVALHCFSTLHFNISVRERNLSSKRIKHQQ
jgi:hypothetical protein